ncbi:MAG TPA: hypothetical protein DDW30_00585 [Clostridiales bacterium]|mgnify:CR=1 FL=1|nr:hypothetical protein [Clostridiales bacterium]
MKKCFSTLGCAERSLTDIIALAQAYQIPCLEFRGIGGVIDNREIPDFAPNRLAETRAALDRAGVRVQVIGASASFHDPHERAASLEEAHAAVMIASALGAPYIRVFGNNTGEDPAAATRSVIEGLSLLAEDAAAHGVTALLETHGDFNRKETLEPILEALDGRAGFGVIWDVMHTYFATGRDFQPIYSLLRPYIRHIHVKDCLPDHTQVLPDRGDIPLRAIIDRLRNDAYDGCISLEWEHKWHPELPPIEEALTAMSNILAAK